MSIFANLTPPYRTIVADPPWDHRDGFPVNQWTRQGEAKLRTGLAYSVMSVPEICALPVVELAESDAHLYLWTTNRFLRDAFAVVDAWGFRFSQVLTWCKRPAGIGPGGAFASTSEFMLFARRGSLPPLRRVDSTWFGWPRAGGGGRLGVHSVKPSAFGDIVERVSPGPYVELFARAPRLGWDSWGYGYEARTASGGFPAPQKEA